MIKVLFVCHGNICRSPMAEYIMKDLIEKQGLQDQFEIASAATSAEEIGNPVYPPAKRKLKEHGIWAEGHHARRLERRDYQSYDYIIGMESYNIRNMMRIFGADPEHKVSRLLDFTGHPKDIADPWYTDDFDTAYEEILDGCQALLAGLNIWNAPGKV
ncbi:MAG: low molecular weight phosphotyrosine protein phosphatase [Lachnospiraceae bacterium]|nr:low molecular weight phosphotyrosine protein phosphatase [Lachnospiraceae bacterium]